MVCDSEFEQSASRDLRDVFLSRKIFYFYASLLPPLLFEEGNKDNKCRCSLSILQSLPAEP